MCKHKNIERGQERRYMGAFYCDPSAQGGIEWKETCNKCGATRWVAQNGRYSDASNWTDFLRDGPIEATGMEKFVSSEN